ncbi:MAG: hypothetical protein M1837_000132 [Sclerophora amabilis]|nr:MAG: hypothetical protein M1837_000132 [Sclerophora amabilis]
MDSPNHVRRNDTSSNSLFPSGDGFEQFYAQNQAPSYTPEWNYNPAYHSQPGQSQFNPHAQPSYHQSPFPQSTLSQNPALQPDFEHFGHQFAQNDQPINEHAFKSHSPYAPSSSTYNTAASFGTDPSFANRNTDMGSLQNLQAPRSHDDTISPQAIYNKPNSAWTNLGAPPNRQLDPSTVQRSPSFTDGNNARPDSAPSSFRVASPPAGKPAGAFTILDQDALIKKTGSFPVSNSLFVFTGTKSFDVAVTKATIPKYVPRKSRNDIRRLLLNGDQNAWTPAQRHVAKKLKSSSSRSSRPQSGQVSVAGRQVTTRVEDESSTTSSESEDSTDSDYESSDEEAAIVEEPSPLPPSRPQDPLEAVKYDTIKSLWRPSRRPLAGVEIRDALGEYWLVVKLIRDEWNTAEKAEAEAEKKGDSRSLQVRVAKQRDLMTTAITTAVELGHKDIVEKLGENTPLIHVLCRVLRDRIKVDDINGKTVINTLELLSRCVTIPESLLDQLKFSKLQARLLKKGNDRVKGLLKKVNENAAADTKRRAEEAKASKELSSNPKDAETSNAAVNDRPKQAPDPIAGSKRPRSEQDTGTGQAVKKPAPLSGTPSTAAFVVSKSSSSQERRAVPTSSSQKAPAMTNVSTNGTKPKTTHLGAKQTGFFAGLQSASKVKQAAAAPRQPSQTSSSTEDKKGVPTAAMSSSRPTFSLSATLASLNKPKEVASSTETISKDPPETAEEKRKRLRKEQRRKLRVTFKPDHSLVDVRIFTHDQAEEIGREDNLVRDAGDAMEEGRMFKQHKEMDMVDEDDDTPEKEEEIRPYHSLTEIDFEVIERNERERNFLTRGGILKVDSPDGHLQEQREANTLMVVYTSLDDVPPTPREPSRFDESEFVPELSFGSPPSWTRDREQTTNRQGQSLPSSQQPQMAANTDVSALLSALSGKQAQQSTTTQAPMTELEKIFAMHAAGASQPAAQSQAKPSMPSQNQSADLQSLLASVTSNQGQGPSQLQMSGQGLQLQDILAQLGQSNAPQTQAYGLQNQPHLPPQDGSRSNQGWGHTDGAMDYENQEISDYSFNDNRKWNKEGRKKVCQIKHPLKAALLKYE